MRDPRQASQASSGLLVELGGWFDQLASAEVAAVADEDPIFVGRRLALVEGCDPAAVLRLGTGRRVHANLGSSTSPSELPGAVAAQLSGTYAIRFLEAGGRLTEIDKRSVISAIWRAHSAPRVDLDHPDVDLHVYATHDRLWFGRLLGDCAVELRNKQPRRPFTRSYEMPVRRARVLVNLSGARPPQRFLDPFCGTGTLAIEASRIGCVAFGCDLDKRAVAGAFRNGAFERAPGSWLAADARAVPFAESSFQAVAADLPYGKSAGRHGLAGTDLYSSTLAALRPVVAAGTRAALMTLAPDMPQQSVDGWQLSWSCVEPGRLVTRGIGVWRAV